MKYQCKTCQKKIVLHRVKLVLKGDRLICKETICCGLQMDQIDKDSGMPNIIRNENSGDKTWNEFKDNMKVEK